MKKHLQFYKENMEKGYIDNAGLCYSAKADFINESLLLLFQPTHENFLQLVKEGTMAVGVPDGYWGAGVPLHHSGRHHSFTPLRQTIVLFMAAMNNEL